MLTPEMIENATNAYYNHYSKIVELFPEREESLREEAENAGNDVDFLFRGQRRDLALLPKLARIHLRGEINRGLGSKITKLAAF